MTLAELADYLDDVEDGIHRSSIERRLVERIARPRDARRGPLACHLEVQVRSSTRSVTAVLVEVVEGGMKLECDATWPVGTFVDVEIGAPHGVRVRARVVRPEPGGVRLLVAEPEHEADERRLRRFLREALRARTMEVTRA